MTNDDGHAQGKAPQAPHSEPGVDGSIDHSGGGAHGWLDILTPRHARFLIFPFLPQSEDDPEWRALKLVTALTVLAIAIGLSFKVGGDLHTGRAILFVKAKLYEYQRATKTLSPDSARAETAFGQLVDQIRRNFPPI